MISSKPYIRKNNIIADKAVNMCWESHFRFQNFDLYCSILRRSYIAPIMDMYQDIVICSKFQFYTDKDKEEDKKEDKKKID